MTGGSNDAAISEVKESEVLGGLGMSEQRGPLQTAPREGRGLPCARTGRALRSYRAIRQKTKLLDVHARTVQRAVEAAVRKVYPVSFGTSHTLRHSFGTQLLESGYDIEMVQELPRHDDVRSTVVYTYVRNRDGRGVESQLGKL